MRTSVPNFPWAGHSRRIPISLQLSAGPTGAVNPANVADSAVSTPRLEPTYRHPCDREGQQQVLRVTFSGIRDSVRVLLEVRMDRLALNSIPRGIRARRLRFERSRMNRAEDLQFSVPLQGPSEKNISPRRDIESQMFADRISDVPI